MVDIENLNNSCKATLPNIRKKSEFDNVINFWKENRNDFDSTMREWRLDTEWYIFKFVKEYSWLLIYFLVTWNEYPWNLKSDLEDLYWSFLKNMSFGWRYIVDSYVKLYNFNNLDQLKKDWEYILDNIGHAKELWVVDQTISTLCKDYINKCIIHWITDIPHEFSLLLTDQDKWYFRNLSFTDTQTEDILNWKPVEQKEDPIDIIINSLPWVEPEEDREVIKIENSETIDVDLIDNTIKSQETVTEQKFERSEVQEIEEPEIDLNVDFKEWIKIVIISSQTQMRMVRSAFSQKRLDNSEKLNHWPVHLDFMKDFVLIDWRTEAPKVSITKIAKFDMIIIWQNDHVLKDMPWKYSEWWKRDGWIQLCLLEQYNIWEWRAYFPKKNKVPDFSITKLRACLNDFMSRRSMEVPIL